MSLPLTRKDLMIVNMGPQHPSMHGVLRLIVTLDGEDVIDCEPILGYLHRGMEKIAENRTMREIEKERDGRKGGEMGEEDRKGNKGAL
uniref:NAD(P)H dehydrogenase subunit H n=1 Tax=Chimonobambusa sichuanensis TaxID=387602 RepID=A0A7T7BVU3_9POAL|nr:NADH-plastoquinone oxidoreductase subunit 7 [Chimonobambusa sichuanensis]QQK54513.1 NADH-plastoquinone oxidoreductase subunit 7 [Chimonobambusa sichuanensis]